MPKASQMACLSSLAARNHVLEGASWPFDDRETIEARAAQDPFVLRGVATAQVIEVRPGRVDKRIGLLGAN